MHCASKQNLNIMLIKLFLAFLQIILLAEWPADSSMKNLYELAGRYNQKSVICTRAQIHENRSFLTIPRLKPGIPATLVQVLLQKDKCHSVLQAYPNWKLQEEGACDEFALQSAVDLFLDGRELWVLDSGICNTLTTPVRRCKPKIVVINVSTGEVVKNIVIDKLTKPETRLQYLVVDRDKQGNRFVYISDAGQRAILVWDVSADDGYRVVLSDLLLTGCTTLDVLYVALIQKSTGKTVLYFTYFGSSRLFSIATEHLRTNHTTNNAIIDSGSKPHGLKMVFLGTDNANGLFIRYKGQSDIFLWNTETPFRASNFEEIQCGRDCGLSTHVLPGYKHFMWTVESDFHDYTNGTTGCYGASVMQHRVAKDCDED